MPYIGLLDRPKFDEMLEKFWELNISAPGDFNYLITKLFDQYLARNGISYTNINMLVGVLTCAQLELYRRIASVYEDKKAAANGEVYDSLAANNLKR